MKVAAGKAYEFASPVKDKLDRTAQKAKRVAEDEVEYPYPLFFSFSLRPAFPSSPLLMSLFVVSLTTVLVTLRPKRRKDAMKPPTRDEMHASLPSTM